MRALIPMDYGVCTVRGKLRSVWRGLLLVVAGMFAGTACQGADYWPEWRGPSGEGHAVATGLPVHWSETDNIAWRVPLPGRGWSTPVVAGGRVWVTTATDVPAAPADRDRRRKLSTNSQPLIVSESATMRAIEIDLQTGQVLRDLEILHVDEPQMIHIDNTYATPTPVLEGNRLYCHFGASGMVCVDTDEGRVLWTNRDLYVEHENGPGSSPVLWQDLLIVHCDGIDQQYIVALDKRTGKEVWKTVRSGELNANPQLRKSYATSLISDQWGPPLVLSPAADWLYGYAPDSGAELWRVSYGTLGFSNAARPIVNKDLIYICTGYMQSELLAVRLTEDAGAYRATVAWRHTKQVPNVSCPLLVGDELYMASDKGIASCLDAETGELLWNARIGKRFWASPVFADGRIYFCDREGTTTVISPGRTFEKLSVNTLDGAIFASPAVVDGALLVRTDKALYCLREKK